MAVELAKEQIKARKAAQKKVADAKELAKVHHREAGEARKVAKKAQKDSLIAANIACKKRTKEAWLAANIAANYAILKQSTANELQKRAEKSFTAAATAAAFVKQLQQAAKVADLPEDLQEGQERLEDNDISNSSNEKSSDEDTWGLTQWPIEP